MQCLGQLCDMAAERIMELLATWRSLYGFRYVPIMWIQIVYSAGTIFLLSAAQARSGPQIVTQSSSHSLLQVELCTQYLSEAGKSWQTAHIVKEILQKLLTQLRTRMETHKLEPSRHARRKSNSNAQPSSSPREGSPAIPISHSPMPSLYPSSPEQIQNSLFLPSVSSSDDLHGINEYFGGFGAGQFGFSDGGNLGAGFFGFSDIPDGGNVNPQTSLTFGDPANLSDFIETYFQPVPNPDNNTQPEWEGHKMDSAFQSPGENWRKQFSNFLSHNDDNNIIEWSESSDGHHGQQQMWSAVVSGAYSVLPSMLPWVGRLNRVICSQRSGMRRGPSNHT
jgi:hypothetical protein